MVANKNSKLICDRCGNPLPPMKETNNTMNLEKYSICGFPVKVVRCDICNEKLFGKCSKTIKFG